MNNNVQSVERIIDDILIGYCDSIAWQDFGANGSPCFDPDVYNLQEAANIAAAVQLVMPKYSERHRILANEVAHQLGARYVTYPWLRDAVCRIIQGSEYNQLMDFANFSKLVRMGMQAKGLEHIESVADVLC